ncbi:macrolide transport system ATP-binding/permease protein [Streptoalloteichus tenebrarius]|uniref:Macrolide transport system ATP-binding/permease protein n=1 Tax=Streptoalloteichus tenebrarius (strain ATCC 17920 / DSM 40477 / JCM 4838 / CBS 697.72 / NBRC 16177 / NCIMB 11028 / NRRL B-12390 / A12253. 1 / ISP 5477) TaxID=1933 RepID=A0ABT1HLP5_STRSD|nr:TlrC/CarA/OleB/SrmB family ABC-F type ribosomal protection protein [Streptoalloteichus tenebrarius]MCP2256452.1 macrolide transport system ATP-binding/permease protein [Streptoalloteichus tenebrarius]BFF04803.1 ABC-F family ATP-binding cassette domain-containing protein [Streptoalloteichus tenebrarius]
MRIAQLTLHDITKRYDERVVLDRVSFTVKPGEKVGVIGDNGSGKSTLLRLLAGRERPDNGDLVVVAPGGVGYLAQTLELPSTATVRDAVDLALADLRDLEARIHRAEVEMETVPESELGAALRRYARLVEDYEARGGYEADSRVDSALHGLGLPGLARDRVLGSLSGGERSRLALAATLASSPELLLLDEPTNDLDDSAVAWLEAHLRAHRGTVVAVTHDRVFLERLTTTILEVESGQVSRYGNGYDGYLTAKAAERRRRLQEYEDWRAELTRQRRLVAANVVRLEAIPRKLPFAVFGHGAFRTRGRGHGAMGRIRNAKERVERLTENPVAPPRDPLVFTARIATTGAAAEEIAAVADLRDVRVGTRLHVPSLRVLPGERLLVTGPNGAGKSTLMRVLAGEIRPDTGTVLVPGRVGHLRQEESPLPPGLTVPQAFGWGRVGDVDEHTETLLSLGLFDPADLRLRVGELSYGQRRRIELARLVTEPVDLLLLDEPTNHLSPALVEELEQALAGYEGALVVVTHDRRMRSRFTGSRLVLRDGEVAEYQPARETADCS